jgi:osmoprotectant transport system ATP-binding protein
VKPDNPIAFDRINSVALEARIYARHCSSRHPMTGQDQHAIEFSRVSYRLDGRDILSGVDLSVARGETMVLLGRSGAGKTTALKMINRLLSPSEGEVRVNGTATAAWDVIRLRRHIGYAIQDVGLFPHYTVEQNLAILPRLEGWLRPRIAARISELLRLISLDPDQFLRRYPDELSGGQRQRVGLARALVLDPPLLLMDEPFGALDPITRAELQGELKRLIDQLNKTVVFVTHDMQEGLLLARRIAVLEAGKLEGVFTPQQFLNSDNEVTRRYIESASATVWPVIGKSLDPAC